MLATCLAGCYDPQSSGWDAAAPDAADPPGDGGDDASSADAPAADASAWCPGNLIGNPGFEADTAGWEGVNCAISRISTALDGTGALLACRLADGSNHDCRVRALDGTIATFPVPATYRATAWLRADDDEVGLEAGPRLRYTTASGTASSSDNVPLLASWLQHDVMLSVPANPTLVELWFSMPDTQPDPTLCYRLDLVCLTSTPSAAIAPPPPAPSRR